MIYGRKKGLVLDDVGIINNEQNWLEDKNITHHSHCYMKLYDLNEDKCCVVK